MREWQNLTMYHCLWNQGSVGTTLTLLFVRLFTVCCSNQRTWVGSSVVGGRQSLPSRHAVTWVLASASSLPLALLPGAYSSPSVCLRLSAWCHGV